MIWILTILRPTRRTSILDTVERDEVSDYIMNDIKSEVISQSALYTMRSLKPLKLGSI